MSYIGVVRTREQVSRLKIAGWEGSHPAAAGSRLTAGRTVTAEVAGGTSQLTTSSRPSKEPEAPQQPASASIDPSPLLRCALAIWFIKMAGKRVAQSFQVRPMAQNRHPRSPNHHHFIALQRAC
jgi:hypothetical protein